ncbi:OLC1v1024753C1 [Oldenlandia corymbosa var. corymbosa]|uniref:OLC1v1024753C1 n=1 Tax=Oldenlandia corymbosa var. corymbosa TaxID=529605 RepID=A0AAV1C4G8_OLDCO|nr:OLC1v1024753C1 [Oldenlandia corymbosa var. corymbosa]
MTQAAMGKTGPSSSGLTPAEKSSVPVDVQSHATVEKEEVPVHQLYQGPLVHRSPVPTHQLVAFVPVPVPPPHVPAGWDSQESLRRLQVAAGVALTGLSAGLVTAKEKKVIKDETLFTVGIGLILADAVAFILSMYLIEVATPFVKKWSIRVTFWLLVVLVGIRLGFHTCGGAVLAVRVLVLCVVVFVGSILLLSF